MKSIILAGGLGTRLGKYSKDVPKCMINFLGKPLIQRQVDTYRSCGINDITIVRKHLADKIHIDEIKYYDEKTFDTHMVVGLFCARKEFNDDFILSYGDLLFEKRILNKVINFEGDIGVVVDTNWKKYWKARFGSYDKDIESLIIDEGRIVSLGVPDVDPKKMHARYVGIIKFSKDILKDMEKIYDNAKDDYWDKPWHSSKTFKMAYMTDFIQALIDSGIKVEPIKINNGWLEFDTADDYENAVNWAKENNLGRFYSLNL